MITRTQLRVRFYGCILAFASIAALTAGIVCARDARTIEECIKRGNYSWEEYSPFDGKDSYPLLQRVLSIDLTGSEWDAFRAEPNEHECKAEELEAFVIPLLRHAATLPVNSSPLTPAFRISDEGRKAFTIIVRNLEATLVALASMDSPRHSSNGRIALRCLSIVIGKGPDRYLLALKRRLVRTSASTSDEEYSALALRSLIDCEVIASNVEAAQLASEGLGMMSKMNLLESSIFQHFLAKECEAVRKSVSDGLSEAAPK
ncbi:MAG: hypothetical protein Kow00107_07730 [Planctomycetota bacterium]